MNAFALVDRNQTINLFLENWQKETSKLRDDYSYFNQGVVLTSLWATIILPKQRLDKYKKWKKVRLESLVELEDIWGRMEIKKWPDGEERKLCHLIRHLRNSLSHVRVRIKPGISSNDFAFIFWDLPQNAQKGRLHPGVNFSLEINIHQLRKFILEFGGRYLKNSWSDLIKS